MAATASGTLPNAVSRMTAVWGATWRTSRITAKPSPSGMRMSVMGILATAKFRDGLSRPGGAVHLPAAAQEARFQCSAHPDLVVDYQHLMHQVLAHSAAPVRGNVKVKMAPLPGELNASIVPPCCSTIFWHTASPSPGLPGRVVKPG